MSEGPPTRFQPSRGRSGPRARHASSRAALVAVLLSWAGCSGAAHHARSGSSPASYEAAAPAARSAGADAAEALVPAEDERWGGDGMEQYEALLALEAEALTFGLDCAAVCGAAARICDLSARICSIAERRGGEPPLEERCADARGRCVGARHRASDRCGC